MDNEKIPMIYGAICGVMESIGAVGKNDVNKQQGFKYRSIEAVMNALNPALVKNNIFCTPEVLEQHREERTTAKGATLIYSVCRIRYRFYAVDGSFVDAVVVGEGMDSGDKATNKAMAAAFKYACFQTFCIPTENLMDDPDAVTPDANVPRNENRNPPPQADTERQNLMNELEFECMRTGYTSIAVAKTYKVERLNHLSKEQLRDCINKMKMLRDRAS